MPEHPTHTTARFLPLGEQGLTVELGDEIDEEVNDRVHLLAAAVRRELVSIVEEVVPTYRSVLLVFDPLRVTRAELVRRVGELLAAAASSPPHGKKRRANAQGARESCRVVHVPVCYGGELGPDLGFVAEHNALSPDQVIALHCEPRYRVYMLGFTPGFPYLGGLSPRIAAPRLDQPRAKVAAGSVGIAGPQTGIYPVESPGGWRIIGRTPLRLFDPGAAEPFLLRAGDRLRFRPIASDRLAEIERQVAEGAYPVEVESVPASTGSARTKPSGGAA